MIIIEDDIRSNQYQMYLNRRALFFMRAGYGTGCNGADTTTESIWRIEKNNKVLRRANVRLRAVRPQSVVKPRRSRGRARTGNGRPQAHVDPALVLAGDLAPTQRLR